MNTLDELNTTIEMIFANCTDSVKKKSVSLICEYLKDTTIGIKMRKKLPWKISGDQPYHQILSNYFPCSDVSDRVKLIEYLVWTKIGLEADPKYQKCSMNYEKIAQQLIEEFISSKEYVDTSRMQKDIVSVLKKYGSTIIEDDHRNELFNILLVNYDNGLRLYDSLNVLLHKKFDKQSVCHVCSETRGESEMKTCVKCKKLVCKAYDRSCANIFSIGLEKPGLTHFCKPCLQIMLNR